MMMPQMKTTNLLITLALAVAGCHKKPAGPSGNVRIESVSEAFVAAGLTPQSFAATDARRFNAQRCFAGAVDGLDTVVCEYGSPDALSMGKCAGEAWAASAGTASVLGNGRALLAVADRQHSDPNGRVMHKITQAFQKAR